MRGLLLFAMGAFAMGIALAAACLAGCSAASLMTRPGPTLIVQSPGARVESFTSGDSVGVLRAGDTIQALAGRRHRNVFSGDMEATYLVAFMGDSGYVSWPQVKEEWELQPTTFTLPMAEDKDAWARANFFVGEHATMKIQVATDFKIETYNPIDAADRGFAVSRLPQGNTVTYNVSASGLDADEWAHRCAKFIRTGH